MPVSDANATSDITDRELIFTRVFDAPRELVFKAWTDPRHLVQWWGPNGFTTSVYEMDVRPGGVWRLTMHGPDGVDYKNRMVFLEVVKPERLVYKHEPEEGSEPLTFEITVTFAKEGAKTKVTMRMLFPSTAEREFVVKKHGAIEGAKQHLGKLAEYLQTMAPGADSQIPELVIHPRIRRASRAGLQSLDGAGTPETLVGAERIHQCRLRNRPASRGNGSNSHARPGRNRVSEPGRCSRNRPARAAGPSHGRDGLAGQYNSRRRIHSDLHRTGWEDNTHIAGAHP